METELVGLNRTMGPADTQELGKELVAEAERVVNESRMIPGITREDEDLISRRGYEVGCALNRCTRNNGGSTRTVYSATHRNGNLERKVVLKIPDPSNKVTSVNALMNRSRRNIDLQEALIGGKVSHPNIVRTVDSFQLSSGRTVNAEDFIKGRTVRGYVQHNGPITCRPSVKSEFGPLLEAVCYLDDQGILHRDISSENAIIPERGRGIVLTDLQNAAMKMDIESEVVPTRGSTSGCHPALLNASVTGVPTKYDPRTEVYSVGAVLYEMVTGKKLFDYNLVADETGKPIEVNGQEFRVRLKQGDRDLESISLEEHDRELKKKLKEAPGYLRGVLYDMLSTQSKRQIKNVHQAKERFAKATRTTREEIIDAVKKYAAIAGSVMALGFAGSCGITVGSFSSSSERVPTLSDVLRGQTITSLRAQGRFEEARNVRSYAARVSFEKYYEQARENKAKLESINVRDMDLVINTTPQLDPRLTGSMIKSFMLADPKQLSFKEDRWDSFVPKAYLEARGFITESIDKEYEYGWRKWLFAANYIQGNYRFGDSLEDVYVRTLCSPDEISEAIAKAQSQHSFRKLLNNSGGISGIVQMRDVAIANKPETFGYFAREVEREETWLGKKTTRIDYIPGYAEHIDPAKREIVDRAIAFYLATDNKGKTHFDKAQDMPLRGIKPSNSPDPH